MPPNVTDNLLPQRAPKAEKSSNDDAEDIDDADDTEEPIECDNEELGYGAGDAVITAFIVTPQVVSVWRGTWGIMDMHSHVFPHAQIFILGIVIHTCFALVRSLLLSRSKNAWGQDARAGRWLRERVVSRIYTYIFTLANIMHWRGGWGLLDTLIATIAPGDHNHFNRATLYAVFTSIFYVIITFIRSSRNLLASPYFLVTDGKEPTYIFTTRFQRKVTQHAMPPEFREKWEAKWDTA